MCTTPNETCLRSFFLNVFFLPFFSGAAAPPAAAGFAIKSVPSGLWPVVSILAATDGRAYWQLTTGNRQLGLRRRLLLLRDRSLARPLTGAGVGVGALTADRQVAAMAESAIRADF